MGVDSAVPAGTVLVAHDQVPGAVAFGCYPEDYDRMEKVLLPEATRESFAYAGGYGLTFMVSEIGDLLEPLAPLDPRPPNRLPLVSGRPSARQRAERERHDALLALVAGVQDEQITRVTDRAWVRRKKGRPGHRELSGPDGQMIALPEWDIWFDRAPGDSPREPDAVQPGSFFGAANRIWAHQDQPGLAS